MTMLRKILDALSRWIGSVAQTVVAWLNWFASPRPVRLVEEDSGTFAHPSGERLHIKEGQILDPLPPALVGTLKGSRVELVLQPVRFLFRPLELPRRAAEFLEGIVRAQIDRLTPWTANDAVFGWSRPAEAGSDRIVVTVAATARALVTPYVQAIGGLGAKSVAISTVPADLQDAAHAIKVFDEQAEAAVDLLRVRRVLTAILLIAGLGAAGAMVASGVLAASLQARQDEVARRIGERRAALRAPGDASLDATMAAQRALERRKYETLPAVAVLETLSQILPDHTYVTELRIEGDKVRITGITRDAPSLIRLMEQSPQFSRATFFAPTTRAPTDPGERFHIEARIQPVLETRS